MVFLLFITLFRCSHPQYLSVNRKTLKKVTDILNEYKIHDKKRDKFLNLISKVNEKKLVSPPTPSLLIIFLTKSKILSGSSPKKSCGFHLSGSSPEKLSYRYGFHNTFCIDKQQQASKVKLIQSLQTAISGEIWGNIIDNQYKIISKTKHQCGKKIICSYCKIKEGDIAFKKCPCSKVFYCSKSCQKKDWKYYHRYKCQNYRANNTFEYFKYFCTNNNLEINYPSYFYTKYNELGTYTTPKLSLKKFLRMLKIFNINYSKTRIKSIKKMYKNSILSKFSYDPYFDGKDMKARKLGIDLPEFYSKLSFNSDLNKKTEKELDDSTIIDISDSEFIRRPMFSFEAFLFLYTIKNNSYIIKLITRSDPPLLLKSYLISIWKKVRLTWDNLNTKCIFSGQGISCFHIHYIGVNALPQWLFFSECKITKNKTKSGIFIKKETFLDLGNSFKEFKISHAYRYIIKPIDAGNKEGNIGLFMANHKFGIFFDFLHKKDTIKALKFERIMTFT